MIRTRRLQRRPRRTVGEESRGAAPLHLACGVAGAPGAVRVGAERLSLLQKNDPTRNTLMRFVKTWPGTSAEGLEAQRRGQRGAELTFLTLPEWYIVFSARGSAGTAAALPLLRSGAAVLAGLSLRHPQRRLQPGLRLHAVGDRHSRRPSSTSVKGSTKRPSAGSPRRKARRTASPPRSHESTRLGWIPRHGSTFLTWSGCAPCGGCRPRPCCAASSGGSP